MSTTASPVGAPASDIHTRYRRKEILIAVLINSAFSAIFAIVVFGGREEIVLWGDRGLAIDFMPQTFIITLMTVFAATLLTRRRVRGGSIPRLEGAVTTVPANVFARALLFAVIATFVLGGIATGLLAFLWTGPQRFIAVFVLKVTYGALVAAFVATFALNAALRDPEV